MGYLKYLFITVLAFMLVAPVAATYLPIGEPVTSPWVKAAIPNQHGMDNVTVQNISGADDHLYVGNIVYPPIYESNSEVVPWELWVLFLVIAVLGVFCAFAYPVPEGQVIAAVLGIAFSGYSFVTSAMIGFLDTMANPGVQEIFSQTNYSAVMVNIIQPVYTVYNPPWLWPILLVLVFAAILGLFNAVYNLIMKIKEPKGWKGVMRDVH